MIQILYFRLLNGKQAVIASLLPALNKTKEKTVINNIKIYNLAFLSENLAHFSILNTLENYCRNKQENQSHSQNLLYFYSDA